MARLITQRDLTNVDTLDELARWTSATLNDIVDTLSGNLAFDQNMKTQTVKVTFTAANTDQKILHQLKKTGVNYIVVSKNAACDIFRGTGDDTGSVYLQSTVATSVTLVLF